MCFLGCDIGLTTPIISTLPPSMILRVDEMPAADSIRSTLQSLPTKSQLGRPVGLLDSAISPFPAH
jgi:hypothetical protein